MGRVFGAYSWADLSSKDYGVTLISRQNAGFILEDNKLSSILLSTVNPDSLGRFRKCPTLIGLGKYVFEYALYPHKGNVYRGEVYKRAQEYLNPLIALANLEGNGNLPPSYSFLRIEPSNLVLSALFKEKEEIVLRIFEIEGKDTKLHLEFFKTLENMHVTNFLGETLENSKPLMFKKHEIKEIRAT